jgi:Mrp family chromosome partitioning ATPase
VWHCWTRDRKDAAQATGAEEEARANAAAAAEEGEARASAAAAAPLVAIPRDAAAAEHARRSKLCLHPSSLVRGTYGDITCSNAVWSKSWALALQFNPIRGIMRKHLIMVVSRKHDTGKLKVSHDA